MRYAFRKDFESSLPARGVNQAELRMLLPVRHDAGLRVASHRADEVTVVQDVISRAYGVYRYEE
ncbi:hypothetical protein MXEN_09269 [Mycobacterium xenopi RIVM700367]|nr:hypothetical protein MXEN_09269 [Mycobacterium xenopi RIVM700367]